MRIATIIRRHRSRCFLFAAMTYHNPVSLITKDYAS